jgi:hypothetical protein
MLMRMIFFIFFFQINFNLSKGNPSKGPITEFKESIIENY